MKWIVYADGQVLARSEVSDPRYALLDPVVKRPANKAGSFEFTIHPGHPFFDRLFKMKTEIEVVLNDESIFFGRVLYTQKSMGLAKKVYCEGALAYLLDSIQESHDYDTNVAQYYDMTVADYVDVLLVNHDRMFINDPGNLLAPIDNPGDTQEHGTVMEQFKNILLPAVQAGTITYSDKSKIIFTGNVAAVGAAEVGTSEKFKFEVTGHQKTLDALQGTLVDTIGGFVRVRKENDGYLYLDWLTNFGLPNEQEIKFGYNLLDFDMDESGIEVFTRLYPTGKGYLDGQSSDTPVFYPSEDGSKIIGICETAEEQAALEQKYGVIVRAVEFSDCDGQTAADQQNVLKKLVKRYISRYGVSLPQKITLTAYDLRNSDSSVKQLKLGQAVKVISIPHGIDTRDTVSSEYDGVSANDIEEMPASGKSKSYLCIEINYHLTAPDKNTYVISSEPMGADATPTFSNQHASTARTASGAASTARGASTKAATAMGTSATAMSTAGTAMGKAEEALEATENMYRVLYTNKIVQGEATDEKTTYIQLLAEALGVAVDQNGNLVRDLAGNLAYGYEDGEYISGKLYSMVEAKVGKASLISEINNSSGDTISSGRVEVQPGTVLIAAINGGTDPSTVKINADKVDVSGILTAAGLQTKTITGPDGDDTRIDYGKFFQLDATDVDIDGSLFLQGSNVANAVTGFGSASYTTDPASGKQTGEVKIPYYDLLSGDDEFGTPSVAGYITFNMANTSFFQTQMELARQQGASEAGSSGTPPITNIAFVPLSQNWVKTDENADGTPEKYSRSYRVHAQYEVEDEEDPGQKTTENAYTEDWEIDAIEVYNSGVNDAKGMSASNPLSLVPTTEEGYNESGNTEWSVNLGGYYFVQAVPKQGNQAARKLHIPEAKVSKGSWENGSLSVIPNQNGAASAVVALAKGDEDWSVNNKVRVPIVDGSNRTGLTVLIENVCDDLHVDVGLPEEYPVNSRQYRSQYAIEARHSYEDDNDNRVNNVLRTKSGYIDVTSAYSAGFTDGQSQSGSTWVGFTTANMTGVSGDSTEELSFYTSPLEITGLTTIYATFIDATNTYRSYYISVRPEDSTDPGTNPGGGGGGTTHSNSAVVTRKSVANVSRVNNDVYVRISDSSIEGGFRHQRIGSSTDFVYETNKNIGTSAKTVYWGSNYSYSAKLSYVSIASSGSLLYGGTRMDNNLYVKVGNDSKDYKNYASVATATGVVRFRTSGDTIPNNQTVWYD